MRRDNNLPNAMLVGAPKCGTTAIARNLAQLNGVYVSPEKEPKYFSREYWQERCKGPGDGKAYLTKPRNLAEYMSLFKMAGDSTVVMECSTDYLYYQQCAEKIYDICGDIKILIVIRDPAERAYSHYLQLVRDGRESLQFNDALMMENERIALGYEYAWHYTACGMYFSPICHFMGVFSNVYIVKYEDLLHDPLKAYGGILNFLRLDSEEELKSINLEARENKSGVPKNKMMYAMLTGSTVKSLVGPLLRREGARRIIKSLQAGFIDRPKIPASVLPQMRKTFRGDIDAVQSLTGFDLSDWRSGD